LGSKSNLEISFPFSVDFYPVEEVTVSALQENSSSSYRENAISSIHAAEEIADGHISALAILLIYGERDFFFPCAHHHILSLAPPYLC
jgi:hypothetical protein